MKIFTLNILTTQYNQWIVITDKIENILKEANIQDAFLTVMTKHTTTGITVNESLECLESDLELFLERLVPEDFPYSHARMLHSYGSTAGNPTGHLKAHLTGNHCHFPVLEGKLVKGSAQDVYFCEFDGPSSRSILIIVH